ncbi:MAG: hypothetical protein HOW97_24555 [Catenulispora sp.]|nr:hypothetical protein [Catenulispora sp.]
MNGFPEPIPRPGPEQQPQKPPAAGRPHHPQRPDEPSWNLHLESIGSNVAGHFLTESPSLAVLAVEDLCWEAATEDWKHRKPHWWRPRARAAWRAEGARLDAKAARLCELADDVFQEL